MHSTLSLHARLIGRMAIRGNGLGVSKKTSSQIDTRYILLGQFGHRPVIELEEICTDLFGLSYRTASRKANLNELPVPVFKMYESQKAPWLVRLDELAEFIDQKAKNAKRDWSYLHA